MRWWLSVWPPNCVANWWKNQCSLDLSAFRSTFNSMISGKRCRNIHRVKSMTEQIIVKATLAVVFSCWDWMLYVFVPRSETVNQEMYLTIWWCLQEAVWMKYELQRDHCWSLHHNRAPAHTALCPEVSQKSLLSGSTATLKPWDPPSPLFPVPEIEC